MSGEQKTDELFRTLLAASKKRQAGNEPIAWKLQKQKEERQKAIDTKLNALAKQKEEIDAKAHAIEIPNNPFYLGLTVVTEIMDELIWESVCGNPPIIMNDKKLDEEVDRLTFDGLLDGPQQSSSKQKGRRPVAQASSYRPHRVEEE